MFCEWYTPPKVIERVREVMGSIDVDPASNDIAQETVQATNYHTIEDSGLLYPWVGKVWCNPPYEQALLKKFIAKFNEEIDSGNITEGIMLTNSGTDTLWNQELSIHFQAYTIGRISFIQPDGTEKGKGSRGQVFTYFGDNHKKFAEVFTRDSFCWIPNGDFIVL